jgi:hypothetical protein
MILASFLLAFYLAWPLAFGGERRGLETAAEARSVAAAPQPRFVPASVVVDPAPAPKPESCYKRYQREVKQCAAGDPACRQGAADHWDMCEATGFWPD